MYFTGPRLVTDTFQMSFCLKNGFITPVNSLKMRVLALTELFFIRTSKTCYGKVWIFIHNKIKVCLLLFIIRHAILNALTAVGALMTLIDFTLSNARRFYSSMGNHLAVKGLNDQRVYLQMNDEFLPIKRRVIYMLFYSVA